MEIIEVTSRTFKASAVRVTEENMDEVAVWCSGTLIGVPSIGELRKYIELSNGHGINRQTIFAYTGWWITKSGDHYAVYRNASFKGKFALRELNDQKKQRDEILELVKKAMDSESASVWGYDNVASETVDKIIKLIRSES